MEKGNREARLRQLCNQDIAPTSNLFPKPIPDSHVYKSRETVEVQQLIPVKKIMGGNPLRIDTDKTWLENFKVVDEQLEKEFPLLIKRILNLELDATKKKILKEKRFMLLVKRSQLTILILHV